MRKKTKKTGLNKKYLPDYRCERPDMAVKCKMLMTVT